MARPSSPIPKKHFNAFISQELGDKFRDHCNEHGGRVGLCLSAAMLMFLEADKKSQADAVTRVFEAELRNEMHPLLEAAREKHSRRTKPTSAD